MPPLMQLPEYRTNALLDFGPLNQGIQQYKADAEKSRRLGVAQEAGNALMGGDYKTAMGVALQGDRADLAGLAMQAKGQASSEASAELDREHKLATHYGGVAQRVLDLHSKGDVAGAQKLHGYILSNPKMSDALARQGVNANDHVGVSQFLMAQAQGYRNPLDDRLKKAQISNFYASADARKARANYRDGKAPVAEVPDPAAGWGMDEDGNMVPPKGPAIRSPLKGVAPPEGIPADAAPRAAIPPSGVGRFAPNAMTVADRPQTAIERYATSEDQQRLQRDLEKRRALDATYGKPPSGMRWNDRGGLEDMKLKNTATERASKIVADNGIKTLDKAVKLLEDTGTLDHLFGDTYEVAGKKVGGFGTAGRGYGAARSAVMKLNFALSGKSVSNAERAEFMSIYMPTAFDSRETQRFKLKDIREFFETMQNARRAGMDDDMLAELYRQKMAEGVSGQEPQKKVDPVKQRLMNKYGLE